MESISTNDVRQRYLNFFSDKLHQRVGSASLVPENDSTTLFTGSGMQPMLPYLLGQQHPLGKRLVNAQKCFRTVDLEEIGDARHTSFFEMLGNWSLGDYYQKEQIQWIFAFLTEDLKLNPQQLYVTAFRGLPDLNIPRDTVSVKLWQEQFAKIGLAAGVVDFSERDGLQEGRIFYYDETKNWWSRAGVPANMPVGEPGGPDSEIFWDFGEQLGLHEASNWSSRACHVNCECGRFLEIGNSVFMEFRKTATGFQPLPQKNVDFGGGLERISAALQNEADVYRIDIMRQIIEAIEKLSKHRYSEGDKITRAFRVIADHVRAATFLIGDAVMPANKDQGYFVRRLIRRAARYGYDLGIQQPFMAEVAEVVINYYRNEYTVFSQAAESIKQELTTEETKFGRNLQSGLKKIAEIIKQSSTISGQQAFDLYTTFGFPIEMLEEEAAVAGKVIDRQEFDKKLQEHKESSRQANEQKFAGGLADHSDMSVKYHTATHLLHRALRDCLGPHVWQKGSNITPHRLRFDFSHSAKLTVDQIKQIELAVNQQIKNNLIVTRTEMPLERARKIGALGLFADTYSEHVSVYTIGNYSREICGGPHVAQTGLLGTFKILKEESAGAGIRRLKAVLQ